MGQGEDDVVVGKMPQREGQCPVCNTDGELQYDAVRLEGTSLGYPWRCTHCQATGVEWYELSFVEHQFNAGRDK